MDRRGFLKKLGMAPLAAGAAAVMGPAEAAKKKKPKRGNGIKGTIVDLAADGVYVIITIERDGTGRRGNLILNKNTKLFIADFRSNVLDLRDMLHANPEEVVNLYAGGKVEALGVSGRVSQYVYIDF